MRRLTVLLLVAVLAFALPAVALAKGPTSVTIEGPGIDEPIELIESDRDLVIRLMEQTGLWYVMPDGPRPIAEPSGAVGAGYTLTWVTDLSVVDETLGAQVVYQILYPHTDQGFMIHTPPQPNLDGLESGLTGWFTAPAGLDDTLRELGVWNSSNSTVADLQALTQAQSPVETFLWIVAFAIAFSVILLAVKRWRGQGFADWQIPR